MTSDVKAAVLRVVDAMEQEPEYGTMPGVRMRVREQWATRIRDAVESVVEGDAPPCADHREVQHRDRKPPWCDACGWRRSVPAKPACKYGTPRAGATGRHCVEYDHDQTLSMPPRADQ